MFKFLLKFYNKNLFINFRLDHFKRDEKFDCIKQVDLKMSNLLMDLNAILRIAHCNQKLFLVKMVQSYPPNTEPQSVFGFDLMPVRGIWILDRSKTGHSCPVVSLDRFIKKRVIKNIFLMPKRSWLAVKNVRSSFQNRKPDKKSGFWIVFNKMAAKTIWKPDFKSVLKWPLENRTVRYSVGHC
jgi:hypothetical protein